MKVREIVSILEADGWRLVRIRGSHHHYKHALKAGVVTVPGSRNDDLSPGTLRSIYKQAGLLRPNQNPEA
jgi:predicted RNA binding protein YcfA (HicA-like mRNA interferase family)